MAVGGNVFDFGFDCPVLAYYAAGVLAAGLVCAAYAKIKILRDVPFQAVMLITPVASVFFELALPLAVKHVEFFRTKANYCYI